MLQPPSICITVIYHNGDRHFGLQNTSPTKKKKTFSDAVVSEGTEKLHSACVNSDFDFVAHRGLA